MLRGRAGAHALVPPVEPVGRTPLIDVGDAVVQNALRSSTNAVPAAAPHAAQFGWSQSSTLLNRTLVERGIEHWGNDARLCAVRKRLAAGERITVAAVGGSITAGSRYAAGVGSFGAREFLYHRKVLSALGKLYPQPGGHIGHNGGVPGTGPTYMEHCVHDHLPSPVDVVLLEYAVNTDGHAAAFERLLRTLLLLPRAALVVVNAHHWRAIAHDGRTDKCWNPRWPVAMATNRTQWAAQSFHQPAAMRDLHNRDEDAIGKLAAHYAVPLVSMRGALVDAVRAGELAIPSFMRDCKHPSGEGHTFLAQIALHRILTPPNATGRGVPPDAACGAAPPLPSPLHADGRQLPQSVCARGGQLQRFVRHTDGFAMTDEGRGAGKLGLVAKHAADTLALCLPPLTQPTAGATRREAARVLWLGYLRSYEHMGRARVTCADGCRCADDVIDAHDVKDGVSVTDVRRVQLRAPGRRDAPVDEGSNHSCCSMSLKVLPKSTSGEFKFKVMSLLLGGADAHDLQVFSLRVAATSAQARLDAGSPK